MRKIWKKISQEAREKTWNTGAIRPKRSRKFNPGKTRPPTCETNHGKRDNNESKMNTLQNHSRRQRNALYPGWCCELPKEVVKEDAKIAICDMLARLAKLYQIPNWDAINEILLPTGFWKLTWLKLWTRSPEH